MLQALTSLTDDERQLLAELLKMMGQDEPPLSGDSALTCMGGIFCLSFETGLILSSTSQSAAEDTCLQLHPPGVARRATEQNLGNPSGQRPKPRGVRKVIPRDQ